MTPDPVRQAFEQALAADEDNADMRAVFADWLEAHGEPEESARHRKWAAAKEWLIDFAKRWNFFETAAPYPDGTYDRSNPDPRDWKWVPTNNPPNHEGWREMVKLAAAGGLMTTTRIGGEEYTYTDEYLVAQGIDLHDANELGEDHDLFWANLAIYVGKQFDDAHRKTIGWSCSC